jgi:MFS family permease
MLITIFGIARFIVDIPAGKMTEKLGCRPLLIAGPLIVAVGSVGCGLAKGYFGLLCFRFVQGIGSAIYTTAAMVMLANLTTPANRGWAMSLYQGSILIGTGLGPTLGGFIAQYFGLNAPFFVFALFAAMAALWSTSSLPKIGPSTSKEKTTIAKPNLAFSTQKTIRPKIGIKPLLNEQNFILCALMTFGIFFMRNGTQNTILPLIGSNQIGLDEGKIGMALTVIALTQFVIIFLAGRLSDRLGRKAVIIPGGIIAAFSLLMLGYSSNYHFLLFTCIIMGIGIGSCGPVLSAYVADVIPRDNYSSGMGLYRTIGDFGFIVGPIFSGGLADMWGFKLSLLSTSLFLFLAAVLFKLFAKEEKPLSHM